MGKHEFPPFRMVVERGRLVPATPADAERLDTWRNGSQVNVTFVRNGGRVMERKCWAILNRAVKECKTPWKTSAEASEAVKLSIGVVNLTKTVGGDFLTYPKSLTELSDPELDEAVDLMIDVIHHVTGVDPSEWRKQVAHIAEQESSDALTSVDRAGETGEGSGGSTSPAAPANSETGEQSLSDQKAADSQSSGSPVSETVIASLSRECLNKFLAVATDPAVSDPAHRRSNLEYAKNAWEKALPQRLDFVRVCFEKADKVIRGELPAADARRYLEGL
jgi:hypothetical protein